MIPVILSGGSGTRLWPVSRQKLPKQFCHIFNKSLQEMTFQRCEKIGSPWLITGEVLKTITEQNKDQRLLSHQIIYEPVGKNTAPAIAILCRMLQHKNLANEVVGVFPSDHLVTKEDQFIDVCSFAEKIAQQNKIVTLGIEPDYPETGYGYIQTLSTAVGDGGAYKAFNVHKFHEKPDLDTAKNFLASGGFYWNSGMFVFKVSHMIELFKKHQPRMWSIAETLNEDLNNIRQIYEKIESISIDYAIMEHLHENELACIPCDIGWSDVGSWDAVAHYYEKRGKNQHGPDHEAIHVDANANFVFGVSDRHYAFVGVDDVILVDTNDAILVVKKGQSQKVKNVVDHLNKIHSPLVKDHIFEHRPWGYYEILRDTEKFKSKMIQVDAHQQLSYQSHTRREEHWIITQGVGEVVLNDKVIPVEKGTHVHIPVGAKHRMRNTGNMPLEFVEVQLGTYFGEDDIVRYQDDYKRV